MSLLDYNAFRATSLKQDPYEYVVVPNFVLAGAFSHVLTDFPAIKGAGSFPLSEFKIKGAMKELLEELNSPQFRSVIEEKFNVDLSSRATMFTVRGWCSRSRDGNVHTDSKSKIITVLLYLNNSWDADGGRLRILRSNNLDDFEEEVSPINGTVLVFKRSDRSWHGHTRFEGARRVIQMNWVTGQEVASWEQLRHRVSAFVKRVNPFIAEAK